MKDSYLLFPNKMKPIGWAIFIPSLILGLLHLIYEYNIDFFDTRVLNLLSDLSKGFENSGLDGFIKVSKNNILDEIAAVGITAGGLIAGFSREKKEDELISKLRLDSLLWAVYINYGVVLFAVLFFYDFTFYYFMNVNMFTVLVFFLIRFEWVKYNMKKEV